ncbi:MAG: nuclear transport factor 2 family protein [Mycobacterium sp.]
MTPPTSADLLAAVKQSPVAAAAHDRARWVSLFTADGVVEDPVGAAPHRGRDAIGRFYDTFIGPRDIVFHPQADIVCGNAVIRDVLLEVRMGDGVTMMVPAILRYGVHVDGADLTIAQLQAFWELPPMLWQFARCGLRAAPVAVALTRSLVSNQQVSGALGFLTGLHRPARRHRGEIDTLVTALIGGDQLTTRRMLSGASQVTLGDLAPLGVDALVAHLRGAQQSSRITAGATTAVSLRGDDGPAVLLIEADPWTVRCYL